MIEEVFYSSKLTNTEFWSLSSYTFSLGLLFFELGLNGFRLRLMIFDKMSIRSHHNYL